MRHSVNLLKQGHLFFLLLFSSLLAQAQSQVQFLQAFGFTAPGNMVSADFNGDGKLDIASTANSLSGAVLLGSGDGTFKTGATLNVAGAVIATADFNGDGKPDLLIAAENQSTSFSVLLGNGDGTFQSAIQTNPGTAFTSVVAVDVNGDGKPDVLGLAGGTLFVLLGNGDGTFKSAVMYTIGSAAGPILTGDFNGDGKLDVLTNASTQSGSALAVLLGNGDGTFQPSITSTEPSGLNVTTVADVNGDGKLDALGTDQSTGAVLVLTLLGNGDGTFKAPINAATVSSFVEPGLTDATIAVADFNGDGKPDLAVVTSDFMQVFLGNGDGSFTHTKDYARNYGAVANNGTAAAAARRDWMRSVAGRRLWALSSTGSSTSVGSGMLIADYNNDGKLDIAANGSLFLGNGDGSFKGAPAVGDNGIGEGVIGDFNNDGKPDVAVNGGNGIEIFLGDGTGALSLAQNYTGGSSLIATADVNGDGKLDLVFITVSGSTSWTLNVMLGNGDGSFGSPIASCSASSGSSVYGPIIGDFNGDKKPDVAVVDSNGLEVCLGKGDGTFASPVATFVGASPSAFALADFNNDGNLDAAVFSSAGVAILLGKGNGTFQTPSFISMSLSIVGLLAADVNGDGKIDLLFSLFTGSGLNGQGLEVWLGNGDGTFKMLPPQSMGTLQGVYLGVAAAADFNGDGKTDLVLNTVPEIAITLGNGDGTFGKGIPIELGGTCCPLGAGPFSFVGVGDFNGDKSPDLFVTINEPKSFPSYGGLFVLLNTTPAAGKIQLAIASGSSNSATVSAGSTANYDLTITGISGTASLACTSAPANATCSAPASVNVSTSSNTPFTVTVATTARSAVMLRPNFSRPPSWLWAVATLGIACLPLARRTNRLSVALRGAVAIVVIFFCSCRGAGSGSKSGGGTPAGTYILTVTATSGSMSSSMPLTLVVQ